MLDSGTKPPENRIHLFDPVGLINDGYGGTYRSSNYASKPRRPTKSYGNFEEVNSNLNGGLIKSYDSFDNNVIDPNGVGGLTRSYESFTDGNKNTGLRSYNSFSMEPNVGAKKDSDNNNISNNNVDERNGVEIRFGVDGNNVVEDDAEVCTPRLWKPSSPNSGATSPKSLNNNSYFSASSASNNPINVSKHQYQPQHQHQHQHQHQQNVSQSSRTQAIAKGRRELMDMVRDLPESFYELSLKDIVDKKAEFGVQKVVVEIPEEKKVGVGKETGSSKVKKSGKKVKKSESKKKILRSRSVDNGRFLLRTSVFPIFSGSRKNKKRLGGSNSFKIAPMPKQNPTSTGSMKAVEKDWWRRKSCISSESEDGNGLANKSDSSGSSGSSSSRSSSSNGRRSSRFLPTCCLFNGRRIRSKK
ncbi:hypothetical protein RND81_01G165000 [Saponaria officinalis]|uniref:Uncharacterized protein n=1 Tax=Saponaria officinalis TaxID=3572 RepID=A0AAW1N860_SAPOF